MLDIFISSLLGSLALVAFALEYFHHSAASDRGSASSAIASHQQRAAFYVFRNNYLIVNSLMMAGDWLQGPYIYALYEIYGFKVGDIGRLFIAGFGSSMVFGTLVGSLADRWGRKCACLLYVLSYCCSCLTKHSGNFYVLLLGRLLGGVSTSLLFSSFESWLVAEHHARGFPAELLGDVFSKSVFLGGGLMAILSGLLGDLLVEGLSLGAVAPFDAAIAILLIGGSIIVVSWPENYGNSPEAEAEPSDLSAGITLDPNLNQPQSLMGQFREAAIKIHSDRKIALLGAMQSLFEASMYTFVFLWTPALSPNGEKVPHGLVFACFMTACMAGSALTGLLLSSKAGWGRGGGPEKFMIHVFLLSSLAMAVPFAFHLRVRDGNTASSLQPGTTRALSTKGQMQLIAFCLFEGCVGVFWPSMMAMRARFVPEDLRSTIMNLFRIPLNAFVCIILYEVSRLPLSVVFGLCTLMLLGCALCQVELNRLIKALPVPIMSSAAVEVEGRKEVSPGPARRASQDSVESCGGEELIVDKLKSDGTTSFGPQRIKTRQALKPKSVK